jgi:hypothetical protein
MIRRVTGLAIFLAGRTYTCRAVSQLDLSHLRADWLGTYTKVLGVQNYIAKSGPVHGPPSFERTSTPVSTKWMGRIQFVD